ncbi:beta-N-acetylhexosaminidase [Roseospira marina]|uniref:beta-N-acetylhexosaminidase n=1 Tax=Roseospira marina TaxID=140057 RepID=UPI0017EDBC56|nr:beta-N-acetylhexosaminidase [Roseospira marina]MBB4312931.1 beta-N-acetylhexosaminidase [Roseospira marina]MBB5086296.1 beta-N-acetylhexosaminidase [Roseospira marina]
MSDAPLAAILGCAGLRPTREECALFADVRPLGFILFGRNVDSPSQVADLVGELRASAGRPDAMVLIDQEGGRVRRLGPPHWRAAPPQGVFGALYDRDPALGREAVRLNTRLLAQDLLALGIDVDCLPLADVRHPDGHDIIGDRSYGSAPEVVADLGRVCVDALLESGVLPVIKHLPGHGRALADSHKHLPVVPASRADLEAVDFSPFRALKDVVMGMTAHVVYSAIDPDRAATLSPIVVKEIIRTHIGFDGLLVTDDLSMKALNGDFTARARQSLEAGCDVVLHCNGDWDEMRAVVAGCRPLDAAGLDRVARARAVQQGPAPFDAAAAAARLEDLLAP